MQLRKMKMMMWKMALRFHWRNLKWGNYLESVMVIPINVKDLDYISRYDGRALVPSTTHGSLLRVLEQRKTFGGPKKSSTQGFHGYCQLFEAQICFDGEYGGHHVRLGLMVAGCYGLPQFRMRVFLWSACSTKKLPQYPLPTHEVVARGSGPIEFEVDTYGTRNEILYEKEPLTEFQRLSRLSKDGTRMPSITSYIIYCNL